MGKKRWINTTIQCPLCAKGFIHKYYAKSANNPKKYLSHQCNFCGGYFSKTKFDQIISQSKE